MITISRKLLITILAISTIACSQLDAMKRIRSYVDEKLELLQGNTKKPRLGGIIPASDLGAQLPPDVNKTILSFLDALLNQAGPEEILNVIQHARKMLRLSTQANHRGYAILLGKKKSLLGWHSQQQWQDSSSSCS